MWDLKCQSRGLTDIPEFRPKKLKGTPGASERRPVSLVSSYRMTSKDLSNNDLPAQSGRSSRNSHAGLGPDDPGFMSSTSTICISRCLYMEFLRPQ